MGPKIAFDSSTEERISLQGVGHRRVGNGEDVVHPQVRPHLLLRELPRHHRRRFLAQGAQLGRRRRNGHQAANVGHRRPREIREHDPGVLQGKKPVGCSIFGSFVRWISWNFFNRDVKDVEEYVKPYSILTCRCGETDFSNDKRSSYDDAY